MSLSPIGITVEAGDGSDATVYTVPASKWAVIEGITACNTTGAGVTLDLKIGNRVGIDYTVLSAGAISANATASYNKGTSAAVAGLVLNAGETIIANGSNAGINVTLSGLLYDI